ncbi:hypothetical protein Acr_10g0005970 [Actinidia rufa]|uniref:Uncharacterized protein n=1 Tax=Actinidia rufa TaxID=165716 RepID=A0A7J0F932_9ERIC|nr:hypothetical protein Acr_10g0005970 [Actinidia rufa]
MRKRNKNWARDHMSWGNLLEDWAGMRWLVGGLGWRLVVRLLTLGCDCGLHRVGCWTVLIWVAQGAGLLGSQGQVLLAGGACSWWLVAYNRGRGCCFDCTGVGTAQKRGQGGAAQRRIWWVVAGQRLHRGWTEEAGGCVVSGLRLDRGESGLHRDVGRRAVQRWRLVAIELRFGLLLRQCGG